MRLHAVDFRDSILKTLLLVGHPGHELRILQWVKQAQPHVVVLTCGDGSLNQPRIQDTESILNTLGVRVRSDWLCPVSDQTIYRSLLQRDSAIFTTWLQQLVDACVGYGITRIVADEAEGYNPTHDVCRMLANQLERRLSRRGLAIENLSFPLVGHPSEPARLSEERVRVCLSPEELHWKYATTRDYAARVSAVLLKEVEDAFNAFGVDAFATESLYAGAPTAYEENTPLLHKPNFETYGEKRFQEGIYKDVIRAPHLQAIAQVLCAAEQAI